MHELIFVGLFAEVEVRRDRVLEEMNEEIAEQDQIGGASSPQFQALWHHLDQSSRQHEPSAQGDKIAQITPLPTTLHNDRPAKNVSGGGSEAEQDADEDGAHVQLARMISESFHHRGRETQRK